MWAAPLCLCQLSLEKTKLDFIHIHAHICTHIYTRIWCHEIVKNTLKSHTIFLHTLKTERQISEFWLKFPICHSHTHTYIHSQTHTHTLSLTFHRPSIQYAFPSPSLVAEETQQGSHHVFQVQIHWHLNKAITFFNFSRNEICPKLLPPWHACSGHQ